MLKSVRARFQASNWPFMPGLESSERITGSNASTLRCSIGRMKQKGSPFSNLTLPGRVKIQFMVKGKGSQSVSIRPVSGWMPSLTWLGEPCASIPQPGGVLNRYCGCMVSTPREKCEVTKWSSSGCGRSGVILMSDWAGPPFHSAVKPNGTRISHPVVLAMVSGRQR